MQDAIIREKLEALRRSSFRGRFRLHEKDRQYLLEKGPGRIRSHAQDFIRQRLASAEPARDGKQTPFRGHPVFTAQHATATCCRGCLEKWHGVAKYREMTADECDLAVRLIMGWLEDQETSWDSSS